MKKHNSKARKSLRSRKWQTRHTKRLQRRSYRQRRSRQQRRHQRRQRTYKLHGGVAEVKLPPPIETPSMPKIPGVMPRAIDEVQLQIARQNAEQLQANSKLAGGGGRSAGNYKRKKQHGGDVVTCGGSVMNGLDGYGYIPPTNCTMVPYTNDPTSQLLANSTTTTLVKNIVAAAGDK
jgi:hypothetical protein